MVNSKKTNATLLLNDDKSALLLAFTTMYNAQVTSSNQFREYGITKNDLNALEFVSDHPGYNVTQLAIAWNKTKGAMSQQCKRLEKAELIERRFENGNTKTMHVYVTDLGMKILSQNKRFNEINIDKLQQELLKDFSEEEIKTYFKVMLGHYKFISSEKLSYNTK